MLKAFVFILATFLLSPLAQAAEHSIEVLSAVEEEGAFSANVLFDKGIPSTEPKLEFINETIQVDIANANVKEGKILKRIDSDQIKSLIAYQLNKDTARFRMILQKGIKAEQFKQGATAHFTDKGLVIRVAKSSSASATEMAPRGLSTASNADLPAIDEASIEAELKSLAKSSSATVSEAKKPISKVAKSEVDPKTASESEIPVLNSVPEKKAKSEGVSGFRLILGLSIVGCFLLALWVASQRWLHKKNLKNAHTNIRVLTQHHLGPKKSLAIISVAGESILIGVTDHNISLIKTLSLLDEEIPQDLPQNFQQSLTTAENSNTDTVEDFAMKGIKDIVSDRLKGMRNLW